MKKAKRFIAVCLAAVMMLSAVPSVAAVEAFQLAKTYIADQFTDLGADQWYEESVQKAYELGLMSGNPDGTFRPAGQVTLAETVTVAARIHALATTGAENFVQGNPWYQVYVDYALQNGILTEKTADYTKPATRLEFAQILAKALPAENLAAINNVEFGMIPDVADDESVYLLYRAGVLTGSDSEGTFLPDSTIQRSEVAAIVTRMALPELRQLISLCGESGLLRPDTKDEEDDDADDNRVIIRDHDDEEEDDEKSEDNVQATVPGYMDENNALTVPFDQAYPDLIANGTVDFNGKQLMIKLEEDPGLILQGRLYLNGVTKIEKLFAAADGVWYLAYTDSNVTDVLEKVREIDAVKVAEYDYTYTTEATIIDNVGMDAEVLGNSQVSGQWYLDSCGIQNGLGHLKHHHKHKHDKDGNCLEDEAGDEEIGIAGEGIVVAVIDTGVDYTHKDLKDNIWVNTDEIIDDGIDNDKNGYVDDYYGVNIVAGNGSAMDDNGHGTHVAGIIAAVNNNTGVVGIAYNATIMPVKAGMSSGYFNQSDVAKAIIYAYENGADVINMSFGGSASTIAVEDALTLAYTNCVLVAAAGNNGRHNEYPPVEPAPMPSYPGAYSYVLGVMSVNQYGIESAFTNIDVFPFNSVEYELYAPGENILSTIPGDKYAAWSGTSMAAPVVSAIAALVRAQYYDRDIYPTKFVAGQLAGAGTQTAICNGKSPEHSDKHLLFIPKIVDLEAALTRLPEPNVGLSDYIFFDTVGLMDNERNNGDGIIDAGETIALGFELRNRWGKTGETIVSIDTLTGGGVTDPYVRIHNDEVDYGEVGTYSTKNADWIKDEDGVIIGIDEPFYLTIDEDCPDDYIVQLNITVTSTNGLDAEDEKEYVSYGAVALEIRRGTVLPNVIKEDMTLTSDQMYIIPNSTLIMEDVTVTVEPGTQIQFWSDDSNDAYATSAITCLSVAGTLLLEGTPDEPIELFPSEQMDYFPVEIREESGGKVIMMYTNVINPYLTEISYAEGCEFTQAYRNYLYAYRYLSSIGQIEFKDFQSGQITVDYAVDCVFNKLGGNKLAYGGLLLTNPDPFLLQGRFEGCLFTDSFAEYKGTTENCVFYGNYSAQEDGVPMPSSLTMNSLFRSDADFDGSETRIVTNPDTGKTYVAVYTGALTSGLTELAPYQALAEHLGGCLAIFETAEEAAFAARAFSGADYSILAVGLAEDPMTGELQWIDGAEIGSFLPVDLNGDAHTPSFGLSTNGISNRNDPYWVLIELPAQYVEEITLNRYAVTLDPGGDGWQIETDTAPSSIIDPQLIYESQDTDVATVTEDGLVQAVAPGTTEIRVYSPDRYVYNTLKVTVVKEVLLEAIDAGEDFDLPVGTRQQLRPVLIPETTSKQYLTYESSDPDVAVVTRGGMVKGISEGEAVITVANPETGIYDEVTVRVIIPVTGVEIEENIIMLSLDEETEPAEDLLGITVLPSDATDRDLIWESSNPEIVDVNEDGYLVKGEEPGFATLSATAVGTEYYAEVVVFLSEEDPEATVVKMQEYNDYIFALLEDGTLWSWGSTKPTPTKLAFTDVQDFAYAVSYMYILDSEGNLNGYYNPFRDEPVLNNTFNNGQPMTGVARVETNASSSETFYALRTDGSVYAWGYNDDGQLGDGSANKSDTAVQMNINKPIVDIAASYNNGFVCLLDEEGTVWGFGNGYTSAVEMATDVEDIYGDMGSHYVTLVFVNRLEMYNSITSYIPYNRLGERDWLNNSSHFYLEDGVLYAGVIIGYYGQTGTGSDSHHFDYRPVLKVEDVTEVFNTGETTYFQTADGKLYSTGLNTQNQLGNLTEAAQTNIPGRVYFGLEGSDAAPMLEDGDIDGEELNSEALVLDYDQSVRAGSYFGRIRLEDSNGQQVALTRTIRLDKVFLQPMADWTEGETYTLAIPSSAVTSVFGVSAEELTMTFTAGEGSAPETAEEPEIDDPEEDFDTTIPDADVVFETQINPEADERDYWTAEKVAEQWEDYRENGINPYFYNNAIINRLNREDAVEKEWLRITAGSSSTYEEISITGNYWGTRSRTMINHQIVDFDDYQSLLNLNEGEYLREAPENVWPFVTDAWLTVDGEPVDVVGNEEVTFHVTFNRNMDTEIPLDVRFGSAYPYADYQVEGEYVDERTWEGTMTLNTLIEGGYHFFSVNNGRAADEPHKTLYKDWGRFPFQIDTIAANAMSLQGHATDEGIQLTWMQDDYAPATMAGYNIYRAVDSADGQYTRINPTVIPAGEEAFLDTNVEPGKVYYYNFTVVLTGGSTDNNESQPSGKIQIMSKDTLPPSLLHTPVNTALAGSNLTISALVTDNLQLQKVSLLYRAVGETAWKEKQMANLNDKYSSIIGGNEVTIAGIEYYISAFDGVSTTTKGSADAPYTVIVQTPVDGSGKGDVDMDGTVTILDAYLTLRAVNDLVNLDVLQFARADLNGDKTLSAAEALVILKYANGEIGSLDVTF